MEQTRTEGAYEALAFASLRLSPIERRNLDLINDPALADYEREGLRNVPVRKPIGFVPVEKDEPDSDPTYTDDGFAFYTEDGTELVKLHTECSEYEVAHGCVRIGDRAFDSMGGLKRVTLPDTLRSIGRLAFAKTGIEQICLPPSFAVIGEKAFLHCVSLRACELPEELEEIGPSAFAFSGLERLHIPASVRLIGHGFVEHTQAEKDVVSGAITISGQNPWYQMDRAGGLYRSSELVELLSVVPIYEVMPGCARIAPAAVIRNRVIREMHLPETVTDIGDDAFRGCCFLTSVQLPRSLEHIGDRAFMDTRIRHLYIGPHVEHIGRAALLVQGESPGRPKQGLQGIQLDPDNRCFYEESGLFCERGAGEGGADMAVLYIGPDAVVFIPDQVNRLAPYAFSGVTAVEELHVHDHMHSICACSLAVGRSISKVHVAFPAPLDGYTEDEIFAPSLTARFHDMTAFFATNDAGTVFVYALFDAWATTAHEVSELSDAAIARLTRPIGMDEDTRETYLSLLSRKQATVCRYFAGKGDLAALDKLMDWGVLTLETVQAETEEAIQQGNAQATACLLEIVRRSGGAPRFDRSL